MRQLELGRRRAEDVLMVGGFILLACTMYAAGLDKLGDFYQQDDVPGWFSLVTFTTAAGFQTQRRRHPGVALAGVTAVLAVDIVTVSSVLVWLVFSDIVYAACVYGSQRLVRAVYVTCALVTVATLTLVAVDTTDGRLRLMFVAVLWLVALVASPLGYGQAVREHRNAADTEREHARALAELAERDRAVALAEERRRLARELHDIIAGRLASIAVQSEAALSGPGDPETGRQVLGSVRAASVDALTDMRGLIDLLSEGSTDADAGHATATLRRLDRLLAPVRSGGINVYTRRSPAAEDDAWSRLPAVVDIAAYRIVAESVANAVTHAPHEDIDIDLAVGTRTLTVNVRNLAPGRPGTTGRTGHGIANMTARAEAVGGRLSAGRRDCGFVVSADLPVAATDAARVATP